jgi:hypothetical protein
MGEILQFPERRARIEFSPVDRAALRRLLDRLRPAGAIGIEEESGHGTAHAFIVGAENETMLIIRKTTSGVFVESGFASTTIWSGREVALYA